jgi:hypothetical protein
MHHITLPDIPELVLVTFLVFASELYRPSDRHLPAKLVPSFADRGCHVVSVTDPYGRILNFLDRSRYFLFQVAPQLYSRGWVDPVPDPLRLRTFGSAGNRTRDLWICSQELLPLYHRGGFFSSCNDVFWKGNKTMQARTSLSLHSFLWIVERPSTSLPPALPACSKTLEQIFPTNSTRSTARTASGVYDRARLLGACLSVRSCQRLWRK